MDKDEHDTGVHSLDLGVARIESIEDLPRRHGFFDTIKTHEVDRNEEDEEDL